MHFLNNLPIKTKITSIIFLITSLCIVVVLSIFIYINHADEKRAIINNISVLAKLIGNRSNAALTFNDKSLATENLASLKSHPSVNLACLYDENGIAFANFTVEAKTSKRCPLNQPQNSGQKIKINDGEILLMEPIYLDGDFRGSIYICASLKQADDALARYLLIAVLLSIGTLLLAFAFASKMQSIISVPINELKNLAHQVSAEKDYRLRANKIGRDEVGDLVDSINRMLTTIEQQNRELQEKTQKANEANEVKSQFLANMSHELRTPINGVLGMLSLLNVTKQTKEQVEYTNLAIQSGNVLLDTVNQILDLAAIEHKGIALQPKAVDLLDYTDELAQLFSSQLSTSQLDLVFYISPNTPRKLIFDPIRARQIFINLITNAIKFTQQGGITVAIDYHHNNFNVTVSDTGIGIPKDAQARVFESFQQADNSSTRPFGGTGLGLAISREICKAMGGDLSLASSNKAGSVFTFSFSAQATDDEFIPAVSLEDTQQVILLLPSSPLAKWFEDTLKQSEVSVTVLHELTTQALTLLSDAIVFIDQKYINEFVSLIENQNTQMKKVFWVSNTGYVPPKTPLENSLLLYKPVTLKSLIKGLQSQHLDSESNVDNHTSSVGLGSNSLIYDSQSPKLTQAHPKERCNTNNSSAKKTVESRSILLVDDNEINRKAMSRQLQLAGHRVETAESGIKAIHLCHEQTFDLVLMDIQMPEMDGIEATMLIRESIGPDAMPIIGISAHVQPEDKQKAINAGMNDYLCKPIDEALLIATVAHY